MCRGRAICFLNKTTRTKQPLFQISLLFKFFIVILIILVYINFFNLQIVSFLFTRTSSLSLTLVSFSLMHRLCKQKRVHSQLRTEMNFPAGSICSSNRHEFSRRVYMFFEQTRIFQEGLLKRHVFSRRFYLFAEQT